MITEKDFLKIESGSWDDENELVDRIIETLKEKGLYRSDQVYRTQTSHSSKSIRDKIIKTGGNCSTDPEFGPDTFWGCYEDEIAVCYNSVDGKVAEFSYLIGYDPSKLTSTQDLVFSFKNPSNKPESIDFVVEIKND